MGKLGNRAYAARIMLVEAADRTIDVQHYLYHDDVTSRILTYRLLRAADRGVRVRLLLDDMTTKGNDAALASLDAHPNIEVRVINPFANRNLRGLETLTRFDTVTRRMHNKSLTVDNLMTIVGGRNIGDEYFDTHDKVNFSDLDVLAMGPAAVEVGGQFDLCSASRCARITGGAGSRPCANAGRRICRERCSGPCCWSTRPKRCIRRC